MGHDMVYYWVGNKKAGEWFNIPVASTKDAMFYRNAVRGCGRVAHIGLRSIGAPEGPPTAKELAALPLRSW